MFDKSKIGQSFAPFTYEVQRNKIHELTTAIGDENPIYHSVAAAQEAGFTDVPISPTTPTMFSFWGNRQRGISLADVGIQAPLLGWKSNTILFFLPASLLGSSYEHVSTQWY